MRPVCAACLAVALVALAPVALARSDEPEVDVPDLREVYGRPSLRVSLYWENDSRYFKPQDSSDRHYTNGASLAFTFGAAWADSLAAALPLHPGGEGASDRRAAFGLSITQLIYTPDFPENPALRPAADRQYAGWLYGSAFLQRRGGNEFDELGINLGVIGGPSLAEDAQKWVHDIVGDPAPIGWESQLGDEVGIDLTYRRLWRLGPNVGKDVAPDALDFQAIPGVSFALGTVNRNAAAEMTLRVGMNLPDDFGTGRVGAVTDGTGRARDGFGWSLFVRAQGTAVQYDRFLSGLDEEHVKGEIQAGLTVSYGPVELGYSQTFMTKDYEEQPESDSFGAWTLAARFTF